jgi:hypothetical protein
MKTLIHMSLLLRLALSAAAQEPPAQKTLQVYDWKDFKTQPPGSEIISQDGITVLKVEKTNTAPLEILLVDITNPAVIKKTSLISCEMKCVDVLRGVTNFIASNGGRGSEYLRNTLTLSAYYPPAAQGGDERTNQSEFYVEGTVNWDRQSFRVSRLLADGSLPERLELELSLPGRGTIYFRPIKLIGDRTNWWSPEQAGMVGGIGGAVIGCFGGLLGCLAGMGKARGFVLGMTKMLIGLGILLTIAGLAAVALKQPYAVWYTLLLPGGILTLVFWVNLYPIKKRYDDMEIRRMTSVDTMGN